MNILNRIAERLSSIETQASDMPQRQMVSQIEILYVCVSVCVRCIFLLI